jgi:DnaJ-class molecular chaperone
MGTYRVCEVCNGLGIVPTPDGEIYRLGSDEMPCKNCGGTGVRATRATRAGRRRKIYSAVKGKRNAHAKNGDL